MFSILIHIHIYHLTFAIVFIGQWVFNKQSYNCNLICCMSTNAKVICSSIAIVCSLFSSLSCLVRVASFSAIFTKAHDVINDILLLLIWCHKWRLVCSFLDLLKKVVIILKLCNVVNWSRYLFTKNLNVIKCV